MAKSAPLTRVRYEAIPPVEEKVLTIARMMARGEWRAGSSHLMLGDEWGVTVDHVKRLAAEASRLVRGAFTLDDLEQLRTTYLATLEAVIERGLKTDRLNEVIKAIDVSAKISGTTVHKHEVSGPELPEDKRQLREFIMSELARVEGDDE